MTRELDDLILRLRTNELELGTWVIRTRATVEDALGFERVIAAAAGDDWLVNEIRHYFKRVLKRLDVTSRSLIALIEPGSCFAGALLELALACDRQYMLDGFLEDATTGRGAGPPRSCSPRPTSARSRWATGCPGWRPASTASRRPARQAAPGDRPAASRPPRRWSSAWSPTPPTTSTGRTRSGSCWRSGPRCPPTRSPAWRPTTASSARRPWRRGSSPASPRGRTGSSSGRTRPGPDGRAAPLRHGPQGRVRPEAGLTMMRSTTPRRSPTTSTWPGDRRLQRALESWQPNFLQLVGDDGPGRPTEDVYLRTAVAVGREGWAHFAHVAMQEYRWGVFLAERDPDRRIAFGEHKGEPVWQQVPGEYRADLQRLIVIQGDTEPASVEQQRRLGETAPSAVRPAEPVPGQRRGRPPPLGDGLPAARLLRPRPAATRRRRCCCATPAARTRPASSARSTRRRRTGCRSSCSPTSPTGTASTSSAR